MRPGRENIASPDLPTGLRNHNALQEDAVNLANNWQLSSNGSIGVVACDLNDLKRINDTHGHQAGDEAIALIGRVLRAELVSAYGVYRTGGDEFTAIYVNQHEDVMIAEMQAARDNLRSLHLQLLAVGLLLPNQFFQLGNACANGLAVLLALQHILHFGWKLGGKIGLCGGFFCHGKVL